MNTTLWYDDGEGATQVDLDKAKWLAGGGLPSDVPLAGAVVVRFVAPDDGVVAAAVVPDQLHRRVKHNGVLVRSGLLELRHSARLEIGGDAYWIAVRSEAELTEYAPATHGAKVYCFLTKAPLVEGDPIAVCPGTPDRSCGTVYKRSAWEAMLSQADFRCANCGFSPRAPAWRPPPVRVAPQLERVFELLGQGVG